MIKLFAVYLADLLRNSFSMRYQKTRFYTVKLCKNVNFLASTVLDIFYPFLEVIHGILHYQLQWIAIASAALLIRAYGLRISGHIRTLSREQRMESDRELDEISKTVCRSSAVVINISPTVSTAQQTISSNASSQVEVQTGRVSDIRLGVVIN